MWLAGHLKMWFKVISNILRLKIWAKEFLFANTFHVKVSLVAMSHHISSPIQSLSYTYICAPITEKKTTHFFIFFCNIYKRALHLKGAITNIYKYTTIYNYLVWVGLKPVFDRPLKLWLKSADHWRPSEQYAHTNNPIGIPNIGVNIKTILLLNNLGTLVIKIKKLLLNMIVYVVTGHFNSLCQWPLFLEK